MNLGKFSSVRSSLFVAVVFWAGWNAQAAVVISDSFTTNTTDRMVGASLYGTTTETGARTWIGSSYPMVTNAIGSGNVAAGGEYAPISYVSLAGIVGSTYTVQVDANPAGASWASVQFSDLSTGGIGATDLLMLLTTSGAYEVYANNLGTQLTAGAVTPNSGLNELRLSYDVGANTASAWINGSNVLNAYSLGSFVPVLNYAGFTAYAVSTSWLTEFDNFQVDVLVPEPSAISLLGLGGFLAWRRTRKYRM